MSSPLSSLKILDFTSLLPGPYATLLLADMGAEVVRVEAPNRSDLIRELPPFDGETSASHSYLNRNKQSLALDLKKSESVNLIKSMIADYDIVIEQFRPGVMQRLGLGYDDLQLINPRLIYCSITGYGQTGPYKNRAGHDINYLAIAGISSYSGRTATGPTPLGIQIADIAGGSHHAVMGILAAVIERQQSGHGQSIDISMTDTMFAINAMSGAGYLASNEEPKAESQLLNGGTFYDYYETKDGRYFSIGSLEPKFFQALCQTLAIDADINQALSPNLTTQKQLKEKIQSAFKTKTFDQWYDIFIKVDACVEPVLTLSEATEHPHIKHRKLVVTVTKPDDSSQQQLACPIKFSKSKINYSFTGAKLGEHTQIIFDNYLPKNNK